MTRLQGKTALTTGAARGIGLAFAQTNVREGARLAIRDIDVAIQARRQGEPLATVYCATRAALNSLTQSAGPNLIQHHINENKAPLQKKNEVGEAVPNERMGTADDLTAMAVFLASAEADCTVAQSYNVDCGQWMS